MRHITGRLFLDEIAEMDISLQSKMLRFLQEKSVQRVGEDVARPVDVRIVCATNRDPLGEVAAGRFREDLFYRLHVVPVELPPLRDRDDDVVLIARHFLTKFAQEDGKAFRGFTADAEEVLLKYRWPGNVRQLQNVMRSIVVLNDGEQVTAAMLPAELTRQGGSASLVRPNRGFTGAGQTIEQTFVRDDQAPGRRDSHMRSNPRSHNRMAAFRALRRRYGSAPQHYTAAFKGGKPTRRPQHA